MLRPPFSTVESRWRASLCVSQVGCRHVTGAETQPSVQTWTTMAMIWLARKHKPRYAPGSIYLLTICTPRRLRLSSPHCELGTPLCGAVSDHVKNALCFLFCLLGFAHPSACPIAGVATVALFWCWVDYALVHRWCVKVRKYSSMSAWIPSWALPHLHFCRETTVCRIFPWSTLHGCVWNFLSRKRKKKKANSRFPGRVLPWTTLKTTILPLSAVDLGHDHFTLVFLRAGQTDTYVGVQNTVEGIPFICGLASCLFFLPSCKSFYPRPLDLKPLRTAG